MEVFRRLAQGRSWPCPGRSEEHTSELQSRLHLVCRLLLEKKKHMTDGGFPDVHDTFLECHAVVMELPLLQQDVLLKQSTLNLPQNDIHAPPGPHVISVRRT